ncbi:MAG: TonB-dependent receptor [Dechloromonas sp.]|jgi:iron complex outermembrane receptor protein|nr:TonB-dependent receptor [Dechloromonas sp.]
MPRFSYLLRPSPLALALAFAFPVLTRAETPALALDPVVVTGSRVEHSSFDLPAAIDVVDRSRIDADRGRVNASEALAAVPGVNALNRQNYAQDLQISSRGFGARSAFGVRGIRLVSDGIPASMPDGQGQAATFNLDRAQRMEVLRGPLSAVYGNHAGGVIQVFTPEGSGRPVVESHLSAGSFASWKVDVASQGEAAGIGYVIDASRFASEGYREHSAVTRDQQMAKLTFRPDAVSKLNIVVNNFRQPDTEDPLGLDWDSYRDDPRSVVSNATDYNTRKSIDHLQMGAHYERQFGSDSLQLSAYAGQRSVIQYQSIPFASQRVRAGTAAGSALRKHSGGVIDFDREFSGLSARWILRHDLAGGKLSTTLGIDHESATDDRRGYENFTATDTVSLSSALACGVGGTVCGVRGRLRRDETDRVTTTDPYVQSEWQGEHWGFTAGVRHSSIRFRVRDRYVDAASSNNLDDSGSVTYRRTTPLAAITYKLTPAANLYASFARGFEAPTFNELFYSGTDGSFAFNLEPATSRHREVGLKAFLGDATRIDVAFFRVDTEDELVVDQSSGGRTSFRNAGETLRRGFELGLDSVWAHGFSTRIAYTALRATYEESFVTRAGTPSSAVLIPKGNRLPGIPASSLFGEIAWRHAVSGFHTALEIVARSKVYVDDTNGKVVVSGYPGDGRAHPAPGYTVANLRFGLDRRVGPWQLRGFLRVDNLFDKQHVGSVIVGDGNGRFYESAPGVNWLAGGSVAYNF